MLAASSSAAFSLPRCSTDSGRVESEANQQAKSDTAAYEIVVTRHGRPAGVLIGFASEDDWFDYRLEHHPEFLRRVQAARTALRAGEGVRIEDVPK